MPLRQVWGHYIEFSVGVNRERRSAAGCLSIRNIFENLFWGANCGSWANFDTPEIVLRDDGGHGDLGYPWACQTGDGRVLATYYFNQADGARHIAGTFLEL